MSDAKQTSNLKPEPGIGTVLRSGLLASACTVCTVARRLRLPTFGSNPIRSVEASVLLLSCSRNNVCEAIEHNDVTQLRRVHVFLKTRPVAKVAKRWLTTSLDV